MQNFIIYNLNKLYLLDCMRENDHCRISVPRLGDWQSYVQQVWLTFCLEHCIDIIWSLTFCINMVTTLLLKFYDLVKQQKKEAADLFVRQWVISPIFFCSGCLTFDPRLPHPSIPATTSPCLIRVQYLHCFLYPATLLQKTSHTHPAFWETMLASIIFHWLSAWFLSITVSLSPSLSLQAPLKTPPPLSPPPFFFHPLIRAELNKENLKGKGKICLSVSALPSVSPSTSCADRQAGRGRALPYSVSLFFLSHEVMLLLYCRQSHPVLLMIL